MKIYRLLGFAGLLTSLAIFLRPVSAEAQSDSKAVVATVDKAKITQGDVDEVFLGIVGDSIKTATKEHIAKSRAESEPAIIEQLISKQLLLKAASKQVVPDAEIQGAIAEIKQHMSAQQLKEMNLTDAQLRHEVTNDLKINKLIEERSALLPPPTEAEIKAYYSANLKDYSTPAWVEPRHILISTEGATGTQLREKRLLAERLRIKLSASKGKDFAEFAQKHSSCPSAKKGGRLGIIGKGQMPKPFLGAAFSQLIGEVGDVVETNLGFHIIVVDKRHEPTTMPLYKATERIEPVLRAGRKQKVMIDYVTVLRSRARITRLK
jgi:peptidyl-prolyl cis-trans isomerase C